jgi:hypothetical protein
MVENTMGNIKMTRKMATESLNGVMKENIKAFGKMASNMEKVIFTHPKKEIGKEEYGKKGKEESGRET